jgi:enoyl-CoA hydratase
VSYQEIRYEPGRVARIVLARPQYRNAQSATLLEEVDDALGRAAEDPAVRVIVVSGEGDAFSSGHDLGTPEQVAWREDNWRAGTDVENHFTYSWDHFVAMSLRWRDLPKPTIAQVHGWCIFGGWLVASSMDLIVAADDARFMTALLQYFPLPFDVGARKAKELLFDNHEISAAEAMELGFVNKVVPRADLEQDTMALAERIAGNNAFYLRMVKLSVNQAQDGMGFRAAVQGAHSHYMLSQLANTEFGKRRARERGEAYREPKRMPLVQRLLDDESGGTIP